MKKVLIVIAVIFIALGSYGMWRWKRNPQEKGFLGINFPHPASLSEQPESQQAKSSAPKFVNLGPAPELENATKWFNTEGVKLSEQSGKVVLVNFWTYSSKNSIDAIPELNKLQNKYRDQGLIIAGVHTPEFAFEKVTSNLEAALKRYEINYAVAQDNNYKIWSAYNNQFWPAMYLIDKNGNIVFTHFGDGGIDAIERAVKILLGVEGEFILPEQAVVPLPAASEIFLGSARLKNFGGLETPSSEEQIYTFPKRLAKNKFALEGRWKIEQDAAMHTEGFGRMRLNFAANKVYVVAESAVPSTLKVYIDGKLKKGLTISGSDMYTVYEDGSGAPQTLELELPSGGEKIFSFTFQ